MIIWSNPVGRLSYEVSLGTGIIYSRKEKCVVLKCSFPSSLLPSLPTSLVPFQGRALGTGFSVLPTPRGGLPRPRGPDGAAGRDVADPALSHPTFRLSVLLVVAVPGPQAHRIPALWQGCVYQQASSYAYQLSSTCSTLHCAITSQLPFYTSHTGFRSRQLFDH